MRYGGVSNRSGSTFIQEVKDSTKSVRLISFIYNSDQTYVLEFGQLYMRVYKDSEPVETGPSVPYELVTPYSALEVGTLKFVQSTDTITLVHPNHRPADLVRLADDNWTLADINFLPEVGYPSTVAVAAGAGSANVYRYIVTAIDDITGEESLNGTNALAGAITVTDITQTNPAVVTMSGSHLLLTGDKVVIESLTGMVELNGVFTVTQTGGTTFELDNTDTSDYAAWSLGGTTIFNGIVATSSDVPELTTPNTVSWAKPTGANIKEYNIYKESNGVFGLLGITTGLTFKDIGSDPATQFTPPVGANPFLGSNNYPSIVTYIQQRLAFANTNNKTEDIYMSKIGQFKNFTSSSPSRADDSIQFNMAGRQVNAVKSMVDLGRLVILTNGGEWTAEGEGGFITPTTINAKQYSYNGSGSLDPIVIDGNAIYQQARGTILRDLGYDYETETYKGNDLTLFSAHLFDGFTFTDWAYQQIPHSILWVVRSDGILLGMTYIRAHQVLAWHRHDLGGQVENITVVPEGTQDVVYVTVKRTINGSVVKYVERLADREELDVVDMKLMDSNLTYDGRNTGATTMTLTTSTGWLYTDTLTCTASVSTFVVGDVGKAVHLTIGDDVVRCLITSYASGTIVSVQPNQTVVAAFQNTALTTWALAVKTMTGLAHLEGETISALGDGFVASSPNNSAYTTKTVTGGSVTFDSHYAVIHVGIPYISDIETLNVDSANSETISDKKSLTNIVNVFVEKARGLWSGIKAPTGSDPLETLTEFKPKEVEDYDSPVALVTDTIKVGIQGEWNNHGRVFLRQVDPLPFTILSISPSGAYPFKNRRG